MHSSTEQNNAPPGEVLHLAQLEAMAVSMLSPSKEHGHLKCPGGNTEG